MFSSSRNKSCFESFLIHVSPSSTQLLVNLNQKKLSHLLASQHRNKNGVNSKVYIVIYLLLSLIRISNCAGNALMDKTSVGDSYNLDELGEIFHKVAYPISTTTTKRSITDYVPSITTVPTPSLTTFRYVALFIFVCLVCPIVADVLLKKKKAKLTD